MIEHWRRLLLLERDTLQIFFNNTESHIALFIITCRGDDCATHRCVVLNINAGWGYYADTHSDTLVHVLNFTIFSNTYFLQLLFLFCEVLKVRAS